MCSETVQIRDQAPRERSLPFTTLTTAAVSKKQHHYLNYTTWPGALALNPREAGADRGSNKEVEKRVSPKQTEEEGDGMLTVRSILSARKFSD